MQRNAAGVVGGAALTAEDGAPPKRRRRMAASEAPTVRANDSGEDTARADLISFFNFIDAWYVSVWRCHVWLNFCFFGVLWFVCLALLRQPTPLWMVFAIHQFSSCSLRSARRSVSADVWCMLVLSGMNTWRALFFSALIRPRTSTCLHATYMRGDCDQQIDD